MLLLSIYIFSTINLNINSREKCNFGVFTKGNRENNRNIVTAKSNHPSDGTLPFSRIIYYECRITDATFEKDCTI
jgi:hypothetical protein